MAFKVTIMEIRPTPVVNEQGGGGAGGLGGGGVTVSSGFVPIYEQTVEILDIQRVIAAVNPPPVVEVKRRHRKANEQEVR